MFRKILVVCVGNICRSPTAEIIMREALVNTDIEVSSAGLAALLNHPTEPMAEVVLKENGHSLLTTHSARQLSPLIISDSDLILVMEKRQIDGVLKISPEARGRVFLLGKWQGDREITDPYRQGKRAFVHAYALIDEAVQTWVQRLVS